MTPYEVLGVDPDATAESIRRAYIAQARRHHPDRHRSEGPAAAAAAEDRMRAVNEAWAVLGDPAQRNDYDRRLRGDDRSAGGSVGSSRITRPSTHFAPHRPDTPEDPDEDDSWRYEPDRGDPATVPPRTLLAAPPAAFALGIAAMVLSIPTGLRWLTAVGLILMLLSALLFVGAPVVALFRSQIGEERARRRRR